MDVFRDELLAGMERDRIRYEELTELIYAPEIIAHNKYWRKLNAEREELAEIAEIKNRTDALIREIEACGKELDFARDVSIRAMFSAEIKEKEREIDKLLEHAAALLLGGTDGNSQNAFVEIRAGGTSEGSARFTAALFGMYTAYAEANGFTTDVSDFSETEGGLKSASFTAKGNGAYEKLATENGIHKELPSGAYATLEVYPERPDETVEIKDGDVRIDIFRSSGAGGQNVNKLETAVRITHLPTGIVTVCQDERSQLKNKERAMKTLAVKLNDYYKTQNDRIYAELKKNRNAECIRTYNRRTDTATDLRTGVTEALDGVLKGKINTFIDAALLKERK